MKRIFVASLLLLLIGCTCKPIIQTQVVTQPVIQPNMPPAVNLKPVTVNVMDKADVAKLPDGIIIYTMTPVEYEKLMTNLNELNRYILDEKQVVVYYISQYQSDPKSTKNK